MESLSPLVGELTIHPNNDVPTIPTIEYSEAAKKYLNFRRKRMIAARDIRDIAHPEFDDMPFLKFYDLMKKADDQYVAPRKNKQDTSINTGTIRDKDTSMVEYATKYDFEPVAQVYDDQDEMLEELAETGEDLVRKSLMLEDMKSKAKLIYRAMVAFGVAMVEDQWVERWQIEKTFGADARLGSTGATWTERKVKTYDGCQSKLWDLRKCYFGDIRKFFLNGPEGQPYFFTVEYISYDIFAQFFADWDRFKYVPKYVQMTEGVSNADIFSSSWTLRPVGANYVELIRYYDPIANEYAFTANGIDMLPVMEREVTANDGSPMTLISGFPLTRVSPSGAIPFAKYDNEPMHDFTYSKPQPAKMRVLADVENMTLKAFIGMMKQKWKPTMGNKSGRNFGPEVTDPAEVINDIRDGDLFPVLPNYQGASQFDFSFYELIKKGLDANSVERSFQGMDNGSGAGPSPQDETATKDMNDLKAQSLKVAAMFDGIISGNCQLYWLRMYSIAANWTKPIDVQIDTFTKGLQMKYRSVTLPSEVDGGQKATKKIIFTKTPPAGKTLEEQSMTVHQDELDAAKKGGGEVRHSYLHPEQFAAMKLSWYYSSVPVPNGSDPLSYMLFAKQIVDAQTFFGPQSMNVKKLKHKFASITGNDFDTWFLSEAELQQAQQDAQQQAAAQAGAGSVPGAGVGGGAPSSATASTAAIPAMGMAGVMK